MLLARANFWGSSRVAGDLRRHDALVMSFYLQYIPRNMHTVFALLCFVVVIHWLIFPYASGLLHWHCGNLTIAPVPAKQPLWIWINTSCEFIMNDCITTTKQSTTKPCAYFTGYTVWCNRFLRSYHFAFLQDFCSIWSEALGDSRVNTVRLTGRTTTNSFSQQGHHTTSLLSESRK